jgi:hypothetical protein
MIDASWSQRLKGSLSNVTANRSVEETKQNIGPWEIEATFKDLILEVVASFLRTSEAVSFTLESAKVEIGAGKELAPSTPCPLYLNNGRRAAHPSQQRSF